MQTVRVLVPVLAVLTLAGCSATHGQPSSRASLGLVSAPLAKEIGPDVPDEARRKAAEAEFRALENGLAGVPVVWRQSDDAYGAVVPQQPYSVGSANCRRFTRNMTINGEPRSQTATACRREDGIWRPLT